MPAASREVLLLVAVAGLDPSDAADICGITPEALRQRLHRARETLSKMLDRDAVDGALPARSEEHTSELQSLRHLVCRLLLEKKKFKGSPVALTIATMF